LQQRRSEHPSPASGKLQGEKEAQVSGDWAGSAWDGYEVVTYPDGTFHFQKKGDAVVTPEPPVEQRVCGDLFHDPEHYVGFTEAYDWCRLCGAKLLNGKWVKSGK
jgi:hypothetical protein